MGKVEATEKEKSKDAPIEGVAEKLEEMSVAKGEEEKKASKEEKATTDDDDDFHEAEEVRTKKVSKTRREAQIFC